VRRFLPYLAASFTGIQVGAALVASEAVVETTGAAGLGFWRYLIASIVLVPFWIASRKPCIGRGDLLPISIIGIGQFGLLIAMLNVAVLLASSARVSFVFAALPLATLAFERMIFHMRISKAETLAILLSLLGIAVLLGTDLYASATGPFEVLGLLAALVATLTGAVCSVYLRPYVRRYGGVQVSLLAMLASLVPLGAFAALESQGLSTGGSTYATVLLVVGIGLSSGAGFWCWLYALSHIPAGHVTAFLGLSPITAALLSVAFNNESTTASVIAALGLVVAALLVLVFAKGTKSTGN
jgi:drug/metabolite transporter (DMT)-like permease